MAVLRRFRDRFSRTKSPVPTMGRPSQLSSSMTTSSSTTTTSASSHHSDQQNELGIESAKCGASGRAGNKGPRFFFWTLSYKGCNSKTGSASSSVHSSPRTPDSSRSVSFEDAETWPWIDDEADECIVV